MKNIYHTLTVLPGFTGREIPGEKVCLGTLVGTRGSVPQIPGASAVFNEKGLMDGTLGGGVLEGDAVKKAAEAIRSGQAMLYEFDLNADITSPEGAICGGSAKVLMDPAPGKHLQEFERISESIGQSEPGILLSYIHGTAAAEIKRKWIPFGELAKADKPEWELEGLDRNDLQNRMSASQQKAVCLSIELEAEKMLFIEPLFPLPKLYIAGAGHIGKALAQQANLLDFEVTVIDDRREFANRENIPGADHIIVGPIGQALAEIPKTPDTYIVIVTRGHKDDADALRACIGSVLPGSKEPVAYIGMIGSRKKIRLMKENFIRKKWCTAEEFEAVHAPIGLEIGSVTIQEIATSISAQLVQARAKTRKGKKRELVSAIILAAGESKRMGKPKMLLPFRDSSIIETVIGQVKRSSIDRTYVVLGAGSEDIAARIQDLTVEAVLNPDYRKGMLSSVQQGIRALSDSTTAIMVLLGDQPMVKDSVIDSLIEARRQNGNGIVVAAYRGKRGHPILFDARFAEEILEYPEDASLKNLLGKHPEDILEVETGSPEILRDIDTEQDYREELEKS